MQLWMNENYKNYKTIKILINAKESCIIKFVLSYKIKQMLFFEERRMFLYIKILYRILKY